MAGARLGAELTSGNLPLFVAFYGDLGVGKTAFIRGVAKSICPCAAVRSPTFAIVNEYRGGVLPIFHFDMYRITDEDDLYSIGYEDYLDKNAVILMEWSENVPFALPEEYLRVEIEKNDPDQPQSRRITIRHIKEAV